MKRHYQTDNWRKPQAEPVPISEGLFAPLVEKSTPPIITLDDKMEAPVENISPEPCCMVVGSGKDSAVQSTIDNSDAPSDSSKEIDFNSINSDPNAIGSAPLDGLPKIIRDMATQGSEAYGVPAEFFILYTLCAMSAVLKKKVMLRTPHYDNYSQLWGAVVAPSGIGKSAPLKIAFTPVYKIERYYYDMYQDFVLPEWEEACEAAKKAKKPLPKKPDCIQILTVDSSAEALQKAIAVNAGITLCRDELAGFFNDFGRYHQSGEVENLIGIFNNSFSKIDRKTDGITMDEDPFMSIIGSIQPSVLHNSLKTKSLIDNGFAQRFLYVFPDKVARQQYSEKAIDGDVIARYDKYINDLNNLGNDSQLVITLSAEALDQYIQFVNYTTDTVNDTVDEFLRSLYSKMEIHLCRLALTIYVGKRVSGEMYGNEIDGDTMNYAIRLCHYFIANGQKIHRLLSEGKPSADITNEKLIQTIFERYNVKSQSKLADALNVSQQAISKHLGK